MNVVPFKALLLVAITVVSLCVSVRADEHNVLYYDQGVEGRWVPYQRGAVAGTPGVFQQMTDAISGHVDIIFKYVNFPAKRAQKAMKDGLIDVEFISLEWLPGGDPGEGFVVSNPLFAVNEYIVTLAGNEAQFSNRQAYYGKAVGTIAGYYYFDDDKFEREDFLTESLLIQGLKKKRFNAVILERETAKFWASVHQVDIAFAPLHTEGVLRVRLQKDKAHLLPLINQGIEAIKASGELANILRGHGIDESVIVE
ncbi:transporter substrate-binding domain-containing protein [Aestuariibacter halophilus]|uniref:Transporter substrate-binding domain-containing protein n=1 Tax=Fluctibacter halophilus TaxID=226011 RepID=A0ABS8G746_9ALTE|nr:transporter substrate-binding domain-containing protein [Aestuariibacter halophilus]MCC2616348.1 transporter substrate-binding domain-containing protein [Aestuariibacter halophilus]